MGDHRGFCVKTVHRKEVIPCTITKSFNFDFSEALESVYPLLDIIFSYLTDNDLRNVAKVKETWCERATRILYRRSKLCWITCFKLNKSYHIRHSKNLHYSNGDVGIFLLDYRRLKLNKHICVHKDVEESDTMTFLDYLLREILYENMNFCVLSCPKVVSYFKENNEEFYNCYGSIFDGIILPEIPGIRTTIFYCNPVKLKKTPSLLLDYVKMDEEIRCLLIFARSDLHKSFENLFKILFKNSKPEEVAVGGGIVRGSKSFQNKEIDEKSKRNYSLNDIMCIAFLKKENTNPDFSAVSFVIYGNDLSNEEFNQEVLKFKNRVILRTDKIAFRICCGAKFEKEEEIMIFKKHFPNIQLLGFEADGEIGWNCFNLPQDKEDNPENKPKKTKKMYPKIQHEWSTIFVIITWGSIIKTS